jgi:integrase/recombinase XerD
MKTLHEAQARYREESRFPTGSHTKFSYSLRIFMAYLEERDLDYNLLKLKDAQEYQLWLTTLKNAAGKVRFSKRTIADLVGSMTSFYSFLRRKEVIYTNPFLEIDRVRANKSLPRNILNKEKMATLLTHLKRFDKGKTFVERRSLYKAHVIAELMYSTGARINEVSSLKPEDVDLGRGTVVLRDSKTKTTRQGFLNEMAKEVLRIYLQETREGMLKHSVNNPDNSYLFGGRARLAIWLNGLLNQQSQKLGLGTFTSHHFRHAVGYHLLKNGCDIRFIQEILGHKTLGTTQVYTKVDKEDLKKVIDRFHPRVWEHKDKKEDT